MTDNPGATPVNAERFACHVARLLADNRCENVLVLDVRGISQITEFFVLASGTSERQMRSVIGDLKDLAAEEGQQVYKAEGRGGSNWVVIDFVDVLAHLMMPEQRLYYDLESLWGDARRVDWQSRTRPGQFERLATSRPEQL
jgi:ribosome-associated protein